MALSEDTFARSRSAAAVSMFGGIVLATSGLFQLLEGLSAVRDDSVLKTTSRYTYEFNTTVWGWIHLVVGASALAVGVAIIASRPWAFYLGIVLALVSVVTQFMFLAYYPLGALIIIGIDFAVIWSLCIRLREDWTIP